MAADTTRGSADKGSGASLGSDPSDSGLKASANARSEVCYGTTRIPFGVAYTRRRKTVAISVDERGQVWLKAPPGTPMEKLDRIVHSRAGWIVERWRRIGDMPPPPAAREFVSGETFLYLGRQYRLKVEPGRAGPVRLHRGWLVAGVSRGVAAATRIARVREALVAWYRAAAERRLPPRVARWADAMSLSPSGVLVREQRKRWGSCDAAGALRLNWRVVQAAPRLQDYVVVHELAHLIERDHTRDFWAYVGRALPDYESRREALRRVGPRLVW